MQSKAKYAAVAMALLVLAAPAMAQSCPLCYTQAASSGARFVAALRSGILVLIVPPMFMSVGITWLAYRKRNQFRQEPEIADTVQFTKESFED